MKNIYKTISRILILVLTFNLLMPLTMAETQPEQACTDKKPDYDALETEWNEIETKNRAAYDEAFEKAQNAYHNYVGCMFDFAEKTFLEVLPLEEWNSPDKACLSPDALKTLIQKTEPDEMLGPILESHSAYKNHLKILKLAFVNDGQVTNANGRVLLGLEALTTLRDDIVQIKRRHDLEIASSIVALDSAFTSLKELRLATVMHVHFQCALQFLDKYRRSLAELRKIIDALPGQLQDASVVK